MEKKQNSQALGIIAKNIRRQRTNRELSQEQLAELCGLHRTYVGAVERGERNITIKSLEAIADAFGVPISSLLLKE